MENVNGFARWIVKELDDLWESVRFFARHRQMNRADYEIYKFRLRKLITEDDKYQAAVKRLAEELKL